jgi:O-antigen/teichoic acid export membrane protein
MGRRSVTRSQVVILGGHALRMLLALGLTKMLGTRLAAEDFGFFALISTTFTVSLMLLDLGSGSLAVREVATARA